MWGAHEPLCYPIFVGCVSSPAIKSIYVPYNIDQTSLLAILEISINLLKSAVAKPTKVIAEPSEVIASLSSVNFPLRFH